MHEMAIAASVLDIIVDNAALYQAGRVVRVKLAIGEMAGVAPEALAFCFSAVAHGTVAAEAELSIDILPLIGYCRMCEHEFPIADFRFICPNCSFSEIVVTSGQELRVEQIEVE